MANPNIVNVTQIFGSTDYLVPSTISATNWTALTPPTDAVNKINLVSASNTSADVILVSLFIHDAVSGGGTAYPVAFEIFLPPFSSVSLIDKTASMYVGEAQSITVQTNSPDDATFVASYETIL
jgi:hypothetical protein